MDELNGHEPIPIEVIDGFSFKLAIDTTKFKEYKREGLVENVKVAKKIQFHSLKESMKNPVASSQYGMLETPDLRFFGRSDQLHLAITAVWLFQMEHKRMPGNTEDDFAKCKDIAK